MLPNFVLQIDNLNLHLFVFYFCTLPFLPAPLKNILGEEKTKNFHFKGLGGHLQNFFPSL